jgi:hypothetical protein
LVVDQVYAHYQHEGTAFRHPRGGQAHYLRDPLYGNLNHYLETWARGLLTTAGSGIRDAGIKIAEDLSKQVETHAPREFGDLETSGHPFVVDDGATVYDRPPKTPRLTEQQLKLKARGLHHTGPRRGTARRRLRPKLAP